MRVPVFILRRQLEQVAPPLVKVRGSGASIAEPAAVVPPSPLSARVDPSKCAHDWKPFPLPGERGRVFQCARPGCAAIGYRRDRLGGGGRIQLYECSKPGCKDTAVVRLPGRGPRGAYIWACPAHSLVAEPAGAQLKPAPESAAEGKPGGQARPASSPPPS